ncbi:hypothetical protein HYH02_010175 [Chlamydomonas schloesseri]|uniref:BACK domain-containing protein n=1 Tax=Chlamydomonas schloesseri TaxID=2026947 RepID=A0A835W7Y1_9CHLO|nr:hypothetical protein HYH02_010175 [Chlamydomonas schloesseri]|eukprot:KAG2440594.1 hypothetical protein HYH02_010175 [Chlamydomonas schloesseri]
MAGLEVHLKSPAAPPGSKHFIKRISELFEKQQDADCRIVFKLDRTPIGAAPDSAAGSGSGPDNNGSNEEEPREVGSLLAHSWVLRYASDELAAQMNWDEKKAGGKRPAKRQRIAEVEVEVDEAQASTSGPPPQPLAAAPGLPEVVVRVRGADDVPYAIAAIKFGYTGLVEVGGVREALLVRRQADAVGMAGCVEACLEAVKDKLQQAAAASKATAASSAAGAAAGPLAAAGGSGGTGNGGGGGASLSGLPALELYRCIELWPNQENDPDWAVFTALLAEAKKQLVEHFGDALAVLNSKELYDLMRTIPAAAMEALLESDDFGTDSESSVLLMLDRWMDVNYESTNTEARRRLCGHIRLLQCSDTYLSFIVPALALAHHDQPGTKSSWLPITPVDANWFTLYATSSEPMKEALWKSRPKRRVPAAWLSQQPRRQCLAPAGRAYNLSLSREDLVSEFGRLQPEQTGYVSMAVEGAPSPSLLVMSGLMWGVHLSAKHGQTTGGLWLGLQVPAIASGAAAAHVAKLTSSKPAQVPDSSVRVFGWAGDGQQVANAVVSFDDSDIILFDQLLGLTIGLAVAPEPAAPPGQQGEQARQAAAVEAQWARYLRDGKISGTITVLPLSLPNAAA